MLHKLAHVGKQPLKFDFNVYLCDVRGLPKGAHLVAIRWDRGKHVAQTTPVRSEGTGSGAERVALVDEKLYTTATLYRSAKRAAFDAKPSVITVIDMSAAEFGGTPVVLGQAELDLAALADLNAEAPAVQRQLRIPRRRGHDEASDDLHPQMLLQMSIGSRWVNGVAGAEAGEATASHDGSTHGASSSVMTDDDRLETTSDSSGKASSALTHDALLAHDTGTPRGGGKTPARAGKATAPRSGKATWRTPLTRDTPRRLSFEGGRGKGSHQERVAELSKARVLPCTSPCISPRISPCISPASPRYLPTTVLAASGWRDGRRAPGRV